MADYQVGEMVLEIEELEDRIAPQFIFDEDDD